MTPTNIITCWNGTATVPVTQVNAPATGKNYTALVTQAGTSAPTSTVVANSLGGTPVWARSIAGAYTLTLAGAWTANKTIFSVTLGASTNGATTDGVIIQITRTSASVLQFAAYDVAGALAEWETSGSILQITVIP